MKKPHHLPTALAVNDDPFQLHLITTLLRNESMRVISCASAEDALNRLPQIGPIDVIVTDLHMAGIDGWRFCRLLRSPQYAAYNDTPVLVVSATFAGVDAEQVSRDLGANAFLAAPFEPAILQATVRDLLAGRAPRSAVRVLIVEPDERTATELRRLFQAHGYSVQLASAPEQAQRMLSAEQPGIAIIGAGVADQAVDQLLDGLRPAASTTVAIVVTRSGDPARAVALIRQGADGYVHAPFDPNYLVDLCEKARRERSILRVEDLLDARTRELRASEARFRALFEAIPQAVFVRSADGAILHVNEAGAKRLGWAREELEGKNFSEITGTAVTANKRLDSGASGHLFETAYVTRAGGCVTVEVIEKPIQFEGRAAVLSVAHDMTARKALETQRADFVAMFSHDIRNPLAVILGYVELLLDQTALDSDQENMIHRIEASAHLMLSLVSNHLALSKIEAGRLTIEPQLLDLNSVLEHVVRQYEGEARRKRIALVEEFHDSPLILQGDSAALQRVFSNLLHNALKFTPQIGHVTVSAGLRGRTAVVTIADSGPGIDPARLPRIFERYDTGSNQTHNGTGLGLCIAKALVDAHGGQIEVESKPRTGATFRIYLPAAAALTYSESHAAATATATAC